MGATVSSTLIFYVCSFRFIICHLYIDYSSYQSSSSSYYDRDYRVHSGKFNTLQLMKHTSLPLNYHANSQEHALSYARTTYSNDKKNNIGKAACEIDTSIDNSRWKVPSFLANSNSSELERAVFPLPTDRFFSFFRQWNFGSSQNILDW